MMDGLFTWGELLHGVWRGGMSNVRYVIVGAGIDWVAIDLLGN